MPINLDVKTQVHARQVGFGDALSKDLDLKESPRTDAVATLKKLSTYIRDGSGQLRQGDIRIVNTTNSKELAFRFKSFGWGQQYRKDRTADALVGLLEKAGVADARQKVDDILKPAGAQAYGRLSAQGLNRLLQSEAVQQALNAPKQSAQNVLPQPPGRQASDQQLEDLHQKILNMKANLLDAFQPAGAGSSWPAPVMAPSLQAKAPLPPVGAPPQPNVGQPAQAGAPAQAPVLDRTQAPLKQVESFLTAQGYAFPPRQNLDKGGFGTVLIAQRNGGDQVVKVFLDESSPGPQQFKAQKLDGKRGVNKLSELYASYLLKSRNANWERPAVIVPSAYIVQSSSPQGFEVIPADQIKARARQTRGGLKCVGLVMDKAPGEHVNNMMGRFTADDVKRATRSGLQTLRSLNERGFIHRDIKPANMNYDRQTGQLHFFDTGAMFKTKKVAADKPNPGWFAKMGAEVKRELEQPFHPVSTPGYRNREVDEGDRVGGQADLHAFALTMLQTQYPHLSPTALTAGTNRSFITAGDFLKQMKKLSESVYPHEAPRRANAQAFLADVQRPDSYAHFILECLNKADPSQISIRDWANREFSKRQLEDLMAHPALQG